MLKALVYDRLRVLSPYWLRRWIKNSRWFVPLSRRLFGSEVYSRSYYLDIERIEAGSVERIAEWIVHELKPRRVIDVGCGPGHLMAALHSRGVQVFGVDIASQAIHFTEAKGLPVQRFDLTQAGVELPGVPYDVAISCEVAEHLDAAHADEFVRKLTAAAPVVYLTAAEPNTGVGPGLHHVNEQPHAYWIEKFAAQGYTVDKPATAAARTTLADPGVIDYLRKPLVFRRPAGV